MPIRETYARIDGHDVVFRVTIYRTTPETATRFCRGKRLPEEIPAPPQIHPMGRGRNEAFDKVRPFIMILIAEPQFPVLSDEERRDKFLLLRSVQREKVRDGTSGRMR